MEEDFQKLINLLKLKGLGNKIVSEFLDNYLTTELTYSTFDKESSDQNKLSLLDIYETLGKMDVVGDQNQFVSGFDKLLPSLRETLHDNICISTIISNIGSYIVFTDFDKSDLIGILKSKRSLTEVRVKYKHHKKELEQLENQVIYDFDSDEITFLNGKIID
jgi:hypothetical protein